jgi:general secretion pathway protein L
MKEIVRALAVAEHAIAKFLAWWLGELRDLVPDRVVSFFFASRPSLVMRIGPDEILVEQRGGGTLARLSSRGAPHLPADVARQIAQAEPLVVVLPRTAVLRRIFELPLAAERELDSAMVFEIDRQTPFPADQVYHAFRLRSRDPARNMLRAELGVVRRSVVDHAVAVATDHDLVLGGVTVEGDEDFPPLDFLPRRHPRRVRSWRAEPWKPIAAAGAVLLVISVEVLAWRLHSEAVRLRDEVLAQSAIAHRGEALQTEYEQAMKAANFLPEKQADPRRIEVLDALSRLLPDDCWVFDLEISGQEARISGFGTDVPKILLQIQQAPLFNTPEFRSPVVHDGTNKRDRFDIAFGLRRPS